MANEEQIEFWAEGSGTNWIKQEERVDAFFADVDQMLLDRAGDVTGLDLLDIGCGTGATSRAFRDAGSILSLDVSEGFLSAARIRAEADGLDHLSYQMGDAQLTKVEPARDMLISRFGVMFFEDPVAAFENLRSGIKPGGRLLFACWAPFLENPWFNVPFFIATDLLGRPEPADPRAPGPFAFSDVDYVTGILNDAGWADVACEVVELSVPFPGTRDDVTAFAREIGATPRVVRDMNGTAEDMDKIMAIYHEKLADMEVDGRVVMPLKLHVLTARNPG